MSSQLQALQGLPGVLGNDFVGAMPHMQAPYNPAPSQPPHRGAGRSSRHSTDMTHSGSPSRDTGSFLFWDRQAMRAAGWRRSWLLPKSGCHLDAWSSPMFGLCIPS